MSGTPQGGVKAAKTNKTKFGKDFYIEIGRKGGKASGTGGFYANRELAREAGRKGGKISKRGPAKKRRVVAEEIPEDRFLILDPQAGKATIEPFSKEPFWKGWFK